MANLKWWHWLLIFILISIVGRWIFTIVNGKALLAADQAEKERQDNWWAENNATAAANRELETLKTF